MPNLYFFLPLLQPLPQHRANWTCGLVQSKAGLPPPLAQYAHTRTGQPRWGCPQTRALTHVPCANKDGDHVWLILVGMPVFHQLQKLAEGFALLARAERNKRSANTAGVAHALGTWSPRWSIQGSRLEGPPTSQAAGDNGCFYTAYG